MKSPTRIFRALADPTRRQILQELKAGELSAGTIASRFSISAPSISRHLSILESAGIISDRREGNRILYKLEPDSLSSVLGDFLSAICPSQVVLRRKASRRRNS